MSTATGKDKERFANLRKALDSIRKSWANRHGPKLKLFGPRYPNTVEFQRSPEGQEVYREFDKLNAKISTILEKSTMGGHAFGRPGSNGEPALETPRMPPEVYARLRSEFTALLSTRFYHDVSSPVDAPEKTTYGDVDLLVSNPRHDFTVEELATALRAKRYICTRNNPTWNFAIPDDGETSGGEVYRQLDIQVCRPGQLAWETFTHSHGDLWMILRPTINYYGLKADDTGLYVRNQGVNFRVGMASLLHLTSEPHEVLEFLGMDVEKYDQTFPTMSELFDYAASTRLFNRSAFEKVAMNSKERQKLKRPMYRMWLEEYLPKSERDLDSDQELTRSRVVLEAMEKFRKGGQS
ncbi:MAG: hypothetical protein M1832_004471 [Thelocarpon impressellum]|nr:MAG: hypothetical protein M1832_004471 [Thelocarpon impressellum]